MPVVSIEGDWLQRLLGAEHSIEDLAEALEQIGCDVEEVIDVARFRCPNCGNVVDASQGAELTNRCNWCGFDQEAEFETLGQSRVIRLDLLAARPDLFDVGGISRALKGFLGQELGLPDYSVATGDLDVSIDQSVDGEACQRPYIRCAVVEMPPIDEATLVSLMKLQEALHWGVGRDRKLASIGVYDLDTIEGPIDYTTIDPDQDRFTPLGMPGESMTGREILEKHPKGIGYARLLEDQQRYPVLRDSAGTVLSMPPIINSDSTKVKKGTTRLFIDVTGISEAAVVKSLDTFVSSLLELGGTAKSVTLRAPDGTTRTSPDLSPREVEIDRAAATRWLGLPLTPESLVESLRRMRLDAEPIDEAEERYRVRYSALRTDFKHMVDVFEDLAIGYGYKNIVPSGAGQMTTGQPRPEEVRSEMVRSALLGLGCSEIMSLPMTTEEAQFTHFQMPVPEQYVRIANPKLKAMTVVRQHLWTGLLEHLRENRRAPLPLRFFELDNVVELDESAETGAREERRVAIVEMGPDASYASVRALVDALLFELGLTGTFSATEHSSFISGRVAHMKSTRSLEGATSFGAGHDLDPSWLDVKGVLGELHPAAITSFGLDHPVALAELTLVRIA